MARPKRNSALVDVRLWNRRWPFSKAELRRRLGLEEKMSQQTFNRALEGAYVSQAAADAIDAAFEVEWFRPMEALDAAIAASEDRKTDNDEESGE